MMKKAVQNTFLFHILVIKSIFEHHFIKLETGLVEENNYIFCVVIILQINKYISLISLYLFNS